MYEEYKAWEATVPTLTRMRETDKKRGRRGSGVGSKAQVPFPV